MKINGRQIGPGRAVYVIAELSANHNGSLDRAIQTVKAAKAAGADAIKLQTYTADTITFKSSERPFRIGGGTLWDGRTLYDLYSEAFTPWEWHPILQKTAHDLGLDFFSSAFDASAVDFLETLRVPVHKVASFEIVDLPLIEKMGKTGKPLILSTGMATLEEIAEAVHTAKAAGAPEIALLKCTSAYPARPEEMNLNTIRHLMDTFSLPVGLSDHTMGVAVTTASVALGACIIEKHFTLSRTETGPDSTFSLEPQEFREMVEAIRMVTQSLGGVVFGATQDQKKNLTFRRSLFVVKDIKAGETFTLENVRSIRPSDGLAPKHLKEVIGRPAQQDLKAGTPLAWNHVGGTKQAMNG